MKSKKPDLIKMLDEVTVDIPKLQVPKLDDTMRQETTNYLVNGEIEEELVNEGFEEALQPSLLSALDEAYTYKDPPKIIIEEVRSP